MKRAQQTITNPQTTIVRNNERGRVSNGESVVDPASGDGGEFSYSDSVDDNGRLVWAGRIREVGATSSVGWPTKYDEVQSTNGRRRGRKYRAVMIVTRGSKMASGGIVNLMKELSPMKKQDVMVELLLFLLKTYTS